VPPQARTALRVRRRRPIPPERRSGSPRTWNAQTISPSLGRHADFGAERCCRATTTDGDKADIVQTTPDLLLPTTGEVAPKSDCGRPWRYTHSAPRRPYLQMRRMTLVPPGFPQDSVSHLASTTSTISRSSPSATAGSSAEVVRT